ncbi:MAG TPA: DEAD/DEAH box helicase [Actinomycetota bacterium]|nr:DEAD/DEAH box helicase [Actinomycetota bacterium]
MTTFHELGVDAPVVDALARRDIRAPFPIQVLVVPDALAGRDVLARSRTGSGKTLAFGLPIAERLTPDSKGPAALVLVPTRELATQVVEEMGDVARAKGLRVAAVYGGVSIPAQGKAAAKAHILVATPGRMEDLANRRMVSLDRIRVLVLDEADRMLDMGFQPQVDRLVRRIPKRRQTMFFSATLDGEVGRLARAYTTDPVLHEVQAPRQTVDEADHWFIPVAAHDRVDRLVELLEKESGRHLVFVRTKRGADRLARRLKQRGVRAAAMHGDMTQPARERTLLRFEDGRIDALVATDVAARGLDLDDITHVVNYDPPEDDKSYVHRVGRTARAGRAGTGVTFVLPTDERDLSRMAARLKLEDEFTKEGMSVAPPRMVFQSRGGGVMGRRRRR